MNNTDNKQEFKPENNLKKVFSSPTQKFIYEQMKDALEAELEIYNDEVAA
jgi:hypothetical protein